MISPPPSFYQIKEGVIASFTFMRKKNQIKNLFLLNNESFWHSCWIVFFVNALVAVLASYGIKSTFEVDLKFGLLPKLILITIIDIAWYIRYRR